MTTRIVVMPSGPKATPEAIEAWKASAQRLANEQDAEVELNAYAADGVTLTASIIATPAASAEPTHPYTVIHHDKIGCDFKLPDGRLCNQAEASPVHGEPGEAR